MLSRGPVVETSHGRLRGLLNGGTHVFRGVRYAASTAGSNRFRPPVDVEAWTGTRDAVEFGASAPQRRVRENEDPFFSWYSAIREISEDCLFLNIFTPGPDGKRPVMVWIHGGGWREFSGTAPGFDGTALARAQDVVVITLNHRLNAFGFLQLGGADERFADAGNAGLLDVVMALHWIRDNAEAFGGDPGNVTLFGESGGASKIAAILAMRAACGLFHKAILQSSAGGLRLASAEEAERQAARFAQALGSETLDGQALQELSMERLLEAQARVGGAFRGMVDERSFDGGPFDHSAPAFAADVPIMAGCTNTEATYYLRHDPRNFTLDLREVRLRLVRLLEIDPRTADRLIEAYRAEYPGSAPSDLMIMLGTDFVFKRNTYRIAALQAASARAPVYAYLFERETPIEGGRMRSPHTSEVPFIFGTADAARACVGAGEDIQPMTERMMACWAAFARHGDPNNATIPPWRPFSDPDRLTMVLGLKSRLALDPGGRARAALEALPYFGYGHSLTAFAGM
jgi:para-nitrobenzyl esterase